MVTIENLNFKYKSGDDFALKDINLTIKKKEFIGVIGNSGAGKTTLTCALNGIIPHHYPGDFYGMVKINGLDTVEVKPEELSRFVGSVFQDIDGQMVASVVEDEILFGLENFGIPSEEIEKRLNDALETIGISNLRYRSISTLSGGQKQKVAIAAIVALRPSLLVLDEPTGELDPMSSRQIFTMLKTLNEDYDMTIVIVEQKIMLLCEFAHRLLVMEKGCIVFDGPTRDVLTHSRELENIGINVPRVVTLATALKEKGIYSGPEPKDLDEAKIMIEKILEEAGRNRL